MNTPITFPPKKQGDYVYKNYGSTIATKCKVRKAGPAKRRPGRKSNQLSPRWPPPKTDAYKKEQAKYEHFKEIERKIRSHLHSEVPKVEQCEARICEFTAGKKLRAHMKKVINGMEAYHPHRVKGVRKPKPKKKPRLIAIDVPRYKTRSKTRGAMFGKETPRGRRVKSRQVTAVGESPRAEAAQRVLEKARRSEPKGKGPARRG